MKKWYSKEKSVWQTKYFLQKQKEKKNCSGKVHQNWGTVFDTKTKNQTRTKQKQNTIFGNLKRCYIYSIRIDRSHTSCWFSSNWNFAWIEWNNSIIIYAHFYYSSINISFWIYFWLIIKKGEVFAHKTSILFYNHIWKRGFSLHFWRSLGEFIFMLQGKSQKNDIFPRNNFSFFNSVGNSFNQTKINPHEPDILNVVESWKRKAKIYAHFLSSINRAFPARYSAKIVMTHNSAIDKLTLLNFAQSVRTVCVCVCLRTTRNDSLYSISLLLFFFYFVFNENVRFATKKISKWEH